MTNRPVLRMMTPGSMGMVFLCWQQAHVCPTDFQRTHFYDYHLRAEGIWERKCRIQAFPLFGQLLKKPNYTHSHTQPGQAQLSVLELYKTGCLCVHTGISGIRDKAAVHDHIKPLAGIVVLLL